MQSPLRLSFDILAGGLIALALAGPAPARAQAAGTDFAKLARTKNCMSCHGVDRRIVGPSFKDVAAKYAGQKDAADKLAQKIIHGGSGAWGVVAMPANRQVSDAEAKQLVGWIMGLK